MNHIETIENKQVSSIEMNNLLEKSREIEHPYYYRFNYDIESRSINANRIRKSALTSPAVRRQFHTVDVTANEPLRRAIDLIESAKNRIMKF